MRQITISRRKKLRGSGQRAICSVDGEIVAKIKNGETVKFNVSEEEHIMTAYFWPNPPNLRFCNKITIEAGSDDKEYDLDLQKITLYLLPTVDCILSERKPKLPE